MDVEERRFRVAGQWRLIWGVWLGSGFVSEHASDTLKRLGRAVQRG